MYVIVEGAVKIFKVSADGKEKVIDILRRGDCLGEVSMMLGIPYDVSAQAVADSILLRVPDHLMFELMQESSALVKKLLGMISRRIHTLMRDVEASCFKSGHERVADYILSLLPDEAGNSAGVTISLPAKKIDLASRLDLTPQHFSRILQDFRKQGLISVDGPVVHVPSAERLRRGRMGFR